MAQLERLDAQAFRQALYEKRLEVDPELLTAVLKVEAVASETTLF